LISSQALEIVKQAKVAQILGSGEAGDKRRSSTGKERTSRRGSRESLESMQYEGEEVSTLTMVIYQVSFSAGWSIVCGIRKALRAAPFPSIWSLYVLDESTVLFVERYSLFIWTETTTHT
jgi:hypothetical protein